MGTRADFYIGKGKEAKWIGSIGFDGYPEGLNRGGLFHATTEEEFKKEFAARIATRSDFTPPERGWPWPWEDATTTDYSYCFFDGKVWGSSWGHAFFDPLQEEPERAEYAQKLDWPDMSEIQNVNWNAGQGAPIVLTAPGKQR